jgi:hypothetical protein
LVKYAFVMTCGLIIGALAIEYKDDYIKDIPVPVATLPDGAVYEGELRKGLLSGSGRLVWPNEEYYEGEFKDGLFHGDGLLHAQTYFYAGGFVAGEMSGEGTFNYRNGDMYEGDVQNGLPQGRGVYTSANGDVYSGEFETGQYHGQGELVMFSGSRYEGGFKQGVFHGEGVFTQVQVEAGDGAEEGSIAGTIVQQYTGIFVNNKMTGAGAWVKGDDASYEGDFVDYRFDGKGVYREGSETYEGEFVDGLYHGTGVYTDEEGDRYEGEFLAGRYHGVGVLTMESGDIYKGEFAYGNKDGKGQIDYAEPLDGIAIVKGVWARGKLLEADDARLAVSPEIIAEYALYHQNTQLQEALDSVIEENPERIDMYFVGVGGDGTQGVFRREVSAVKQWFDERYGTKQRSINLINSRFEHEKYLMATTTSIEQTLQSVSAKMDKENDILFVYLSSHGSSDFRFYLAQPGLSLAALSAEALGNMLAALPVRHKVVVISACYSGGFVKPLKDEYVMVITAASEDKASFGCSDRSTMTYFGEAFFKDALFNKDAPSTSFVAAFDRAREIIKGREAEQALENSNPLIFKPKAIVEKLKRWREQGEKEQNAVEEIEG